MRLPLFLIVFLFLSVASIPTYAKDGGALAVWLTKVRKAAAAAHLPHNEVEKALSSITYQKRASQSANKQPEMKMTLTRYMELLLSIRRIKEGCDVLNDKREEIFSIAEKYRVDPYILTSIWGIETHYGTRMGHYLVLNVLTSLGIDGWRPDFAMRETISALKIIIQEKKDPSELVGSWAGAMGQTQMIPSTFLQYAVDETGEGHRDIWTNTRDALGSSANYLVKKGKYKLDERWGIAVQEPTGKIALEEKHDLSWFKKRGIMPLHPQTEKQPFPADMPTKDLLLIAAPEEVGASYFLVGNNFRSLLAYNNVYLYAITVGTMADTLESSCTKK